MPFPARTLTHNGQTRTLGEWAKLFKIPENTIRSRIDKQGWTVGRAIETPLDSRFGRRKLALNVPRPVPPMKRHRSRALAYATWYAEGKQRYRYFGPWKSDEAAKAYQRFAAEWVAKCVTVPGEVGQPVPVSLLVIRFLEWARGHYLKDGALTGSYSKFRQALAVLNDLYGETPVSDFGADQLRAYVVELIRRGLCRRTVNQYQWAVTFVFSWGVTRHGGMVPAGVVHVLERVEKQKSGRSLAPDSKPTRAVPTADIEAAIPHLHRRPAARTIFEAAVRLQLASGMRSGELCALRAGEIDRSGEVWRYEPRAVNKNRHRGQRRIVWFGPRAQAALAPLLAGLGPTDHVFAYPRRKGGPRLPITVNLLQGRVNVACKRAGVTPWHPHQLRHNRATELQRRYECDEAVRLGIGDTPEVARQVYVDDPAEAVAKRIARETG